MADTGLSPIQVGPFSLKGGNSTPSLSQNHGDFSPRNLLPKDVPHIVQQAALRQSAEASTNATSSTVGANDRLNQFKDIHLQQTPPDAEELTNYDLGAPPPSSTRVNAVGINKQLFSADHVHLILLDRTFCARFASFLQKYRPDHVAILATYQATQKAKAAVDYANAIAQALPTWSGDPGASTAAATLDLEFKSKSQNALDTLVEQALPAYITHRLVTIVTESLVKEITGNNTPMMQDLIGGLAEVYCLTDPSQPDNPIVYASEGFYETTQYGMDYVIGRNCRFLQGPDTLPTSVRRVTEAIEEGKEVCETILNYRRDGTPFLNLLMIAPLYDNKGRIRYFIGCQIDVTGLIDAGRSLDSFQRLLAREHMQRRFGDAVQKTGSPALGELGQLLSLEELDVLKSTAGSSISGDSLTTTGPQARANMSRRHLGMEELEEKTLWPAAHFGPSGRLPGVYQNYILVRPYPSMRITFTSPALRIPGLVQSRLLSRIGGPEHIREGLLEAFQECVSVTAKVSWLTQSINPGDAGYLAGKPRWLHCTPLLGSDHKVGVWMIVIVEQEEITGSLNVHQSSTRQQNARLPLRTQDHTRTPFLTDRHGPAKMYAHYLRGTIKMNTTEPLRKTDSLRASSERSREENSLDLE